MDKSNSYYTLFLNFFDKDSAWIMTNFILAKCVDCNDQYHSEFSTCRCNKHRCIQHTFLKTIIQNDNIVCNTCVAEFTSKTFLRLQIQCMLCQEESTATYGYRDRVCYCAKHAYFRKVLYFEFTCLDDKCINIAMTNSQHCSEHKKIRTNDYCDTTIAIPSEDGKKCAFCKKKYISMKSCLCSSYCDYCYTICVFVNNGTIVCSKCSDKEYSDNYRVGPNIMCHYDDCKDMALYHYYGMILFCDNFGIDVHCERMLKCKITDCKKNTVNDMFCYEHSSKKVQRKVLKLFR